MKTTTLLFGTLTIVMALAVEVKAQSSDTNIVAPEITSQPQSVLVHAFATVSFAVTATGTPQLNYTWLFNDAAIPDINSNTLTIPCVTQSNLGTYFVSVASDYGQDDSSNVMLVMYPFIATPFKGAVTYWGKCATLRIKAWGTGPLSYQWFDNGTAIVDATNEDLTLTCIRATNAGFYSVVVSNQFGSVTNEPAEVIVEPAGVCLGLCPAVTIDGVVGYSYIIQRTPDLSDTNSWVTMTNLTLEQPVQIWVDTNTDASLPVNPHRFYRVMPGQ
jgi:hypothetical protein